MPVTCPFCLALVEPARDAAGQMVCPRCSNTGQPNPGQPQPPGAMMMAPTPAAQGVFPFQAPPPHAKGATAAMVCGIIGVVAWFAGVILGVVAVGLGIAAKRRIRRQPGLAGGGKATAGIVLGSIAIVISIIAISLGGLTDFADYGNRTNHIADSMDIAADDGGAQGFAVLRYSAKVTYHVTAANGGPIWVGLYSVSDANDPVLDEERLKHSSAGTTASGTVTLTKGDYALYMECQAAAPCRVTYTIDFV